MDMQIVEVYKGKMPVGGPKLKWYDIVKDVITQLRLKDNERHALNRDLWKNQLSCPLLT